MGRCLTNSRNSPWALGEAVYLKHLQHSAPGCLAVSAHSSPLSQRVAFYPSALPTATYERGIDPCYPISHQPLFGEARISVGSSCQEGQDLALLPIALPAAVQHQRAQCR